MHDVSQSRAPKHQCTDVSSLKIASMGVAPAPSATSRIRSWTLRHVLDESALNNGNFDTAPLMTTGLESNSTSSVQSRRAQDHSVMLPLEVYLSRHFIYNSMPEMQVWRTTTKGTNLCFLVKPLKTQLAAPWAFWRFFDWRIKTVHVIASIAIVAKEELIIILGGATKGAALALYALPGVLFDGDDHVFREL